MQSELWDRFRFFLNCQAIEFDQLSRTEFKLFPRGQPDRLAVEVFVKQVFVDEPLPILMFDYSKAKAESYWIYRKAIQDLMIFVEGNKGFLDVSLSGSQIKIFWQDEQSLLAIKKYVSRFEERKFELDENGERAALLVFNYTPIYSHYGLNDTLFLHIQDEMERFADHFATTIIAEGHQELIAYCPNVEVAKRFKDRFSKYCDLKVTNQYKQQVPLKISCCVNRKLA